MKNLLTCSALLATLALVAAPAAAGGSKGAIGIGAEYQLSGTGGVSATYDGGQFHVGAVVGMSDPDGPDNGTIDVGGHFYWHVHSTAMADFGVGAGLGMIFGKLGNPSDDNTTSIYIEPGFQIRAFVASNVALSFTGGFSIGVGDDKGFLMSGDFTGAAGVSYYFF